MSSHSATPRQEQSRQLARRCRLHYVSDVEPGFRRIKRGRGFAYVTEAGEPLRDAAALERIRRLAIPPAWTAVWICRDPQGHLQATGRDDRGRKQYLYHERWRAIADETKFAKLLDVGAALPRIRRQVAADLRRRSLTRARVLAAMVRLLDATGIRVGNLEYRRDNGTYGLTTLTRRHVRVEGSLLRLDFRGKGGIRHQHEVRDASLARVLRQCLSQPGSAVFQYEHDGELCSVTADDVNEYLAEASGGLLTAKDFRTWHASVHVAAELARSEAPPSVRRCIRLCNSAVAKAAARLGNTTTVCRKYYVHTGLIDSFRDGEFPRLAAEFTPARRKWYAPEEQLLMHILRNVA